MEVMLMIFTDGSLFKANGAFWTQKWHIVRNSSGSVLRNFLKFCRMNGANSPWNLYYWLFQKKSFLVQMSHL